MSNFEEQYKDLVDNVAITGTTRKTRNGRTHSIFNTSLEFDLNSGTFPVLTSRKIYVRGILGEYAAIIRGPKSLEDFEIWGCNYWKLWAKDDGTINVDYGNKWLDFNGFLQLSWLLNEIRNNPTSRRLLLSGWDPANLANLDLPCCHYMYQFYVRDGYLDMIWHQRSADVMIGIPSDAVFAATMLLSFASACDLKPGKCSMIFGDTHIYYEHLPQAALYLDRPMLEAPEFSFVGRSDPRLFLPEDLKLFNYESKPGIKFELKA